MLKFIWTLKRMRNKRLKARAKNLKPNAFQISLCDQNPEIAQVLAETFQDVAEVEVFQGNILNLSAQVLVSPANSFGDMGGGLDKSIDDFYRGEAQRKAINFIKEEFLGEMPVGMAHILKMDSGQYPYLMIAPTMRIPGSIRGSLNVYLAMRAILIALVLSHRKNLDIKSICIPALGTGIGGMPYREAAEQMRKAYENIMKGEYLKIHHPSLAPYAAPNFTFRPLKGG